MRDNFDGILTTAQFLDMAMYDLGYGSSKEDLTEDDIKKIMNYICHWASRVRSKDESNSEVNLFGILFALTICLLEFPDYYEKYELSQTN